MLQLFGARPPNHSCLACLRSNTPTEDTFLLGNPRCYSPMEHSHSWACDNYLFISIIVNKYCSGRLPWWLSSKESACNTGDAGDSDSIPGSVRSPGGGHGNPLQYSCWKMPWTEEPGGLQSTGSQSQTRLKRVNVHTHTAQEQNSF